MPYENCIEFDTTYQTPRFISDWYQSIFLISQGCLETVKKLLGEGADPNTKDHAGWTPLVSESSTVNSREFF